MGTQCVLTVSFAPKNIADHWGHLNKVWKTLLSRTVPEEDLELNPAIPSQNSYFAALCASGQEEVEWGEPKPEWTRMDWNGPKRAGMRRNDTGIDQRSYLISRNIPFTLSSFFYLKIHAWNLSELLSKIKERKMFNKHSVHLIIITLINVWKTKQLTVMLHQVSNSVKIRTHTATFCTMFVIT